MKTDQFEVSTTNRPHLVALDSVRGIAALSIVVMHFAVSAPIVAPYFRNAYLMVDLFFVLSGFAIYYAYHDRLQTLAQVRRFVWLRFWRLYPIHLVMLLYFIAVELAKPVAGLFVPIHHAAFSLGGWRAIAENLLLLQSFNISDSLSFNGPSWSISSEFYVYIFFAGIAVLLCRENRILWASFAICFITMAVLAAFDPALNWTFDNGWVRGVAGFFAGILTFGVYQKLRSHIPSQLDPGAAALLALAGVAAFLVFKPDGGFMTVAIIPLSAVLILLVALSPPRGVIRILASKPLRWLGVTSYSIYMVHAAISFGLGYLIKTMIPGSSTPQVQFALVLLNVALVIAVASVTYLWIEMPIRAWSRK